MSEFDDALAGLYKVFATFPPKEIFGCYCCLDQPERDLLLTKKLGVLTSADLASYASSVFLTVGDVSDYRYFLPRIFDLSASDLNWWPSPEVVLRALTLAEWDGWPGDEREAIERFLRAWLDQWSGEREGGWSEIDSLLCGVARAGLDISPYLQRLLAPSGLPGLRELDRLNRDAALRGASAENFWGDAPDDWRRLTDFLLSDDVAVRLSSKT